MLILNADDPVLQLPFLAVFVSPDLRASRTAVSHMSLQGILAWESVATLLAQKCFRFHMYLTQI